MVNSVRLSDIFSGTPSFRADADDGAENIKARLDYLISKGQKEVD